VRQENTEGIGIGGAGRSGCREMEGAMLMTIFIILLLLWLLGVVTSYTFYGFIHLLLVVAIAVLLIRIIQGRPSV
jgi:predicted ferric reductase